MPTIYASVSVAETDFYEGLAQPGYYLEGRPVELVDVGEGIAVFCEKEGVGLVQKKRCTMLIREVMQRPHKATISYFDYEAGDGAPGEDDYIEPFVECSVVVLTGLDFTRNRLVTWARKPGSRSLGSWSLVFSYIGFCYWLSGRRPDIELLYGLRKLSSYFFG